LNEKKDAGSTYVPDLGSTTRIQMGIRNNSRATISNECDTFGRIHSPVSRYSLTVQRVKQRSAKAGGESGDAAAYVVETMVGEGKKEWRRC